MTTAAPLATTVLAHSSHRAAARTAGGLGLLAGTVLICAGAAAWKAVASELAHQNITVAPDAPAFAGKPVRGPLTAYAEAQIINEHALKISGGNTYAELAQDDPKRTIVMNASFLRASLFTSVVSFGVSAFAVGAGLITLGFGAGLRRLGQ
jgi:hypothetical protein